MESLLIEKRRLQDQRELLLKEIDHLQKIVEICLGGLKEDFALLRENALQNEEITKRGVEEIEPKFPPLPTQEDKSQKPTDYDMIVGTLRIVEGVIGLTLRLASPRRRRP